MPLSKEYIRATHPSIAGQAFVEVPVGEPLLEGFYDISKPPVIDNTSMMVKSREVVRQDQGAQSEQRVGENVQVTEPSIAGQASYEIPTDQPFRIGTVILPNRK